MNKKQVNMKQVDITDHLPGLTRVWTPNIMATTCRFCVLNTRGDSCVKHLLCRQADYCVPKINPDTDIPCDYYFTARTPGIKGKVANLEQVHTRFIVLKFDIAGLRIELAREVR